jgi:hypothetical protein
MEDISFPIFSFTWVTGILTLANCEANSVWRVSNKEGSREQDMSPHAMDI